MSRKSFSSLLPTQKRGEEGKNGAWSRVTGLYATKNEEQGQIKRLQYEKEKRGGEKNRK